MSQERMKTERVDPYTEGMVWYPVLSRSRLRVLIFGPGIEQLLYQDIDHQRPRVSLYFIS